MKFKYFILLAFTFVTMLFFTGCANTQSVDLQPKVDEIDKLIEVNKTTYSELRELLGTPAFEADVYDGNTKLVCFIYTTKIFKNVGGNVLKGLVTFGFGSKSAPMLAKNMFFTLDLNGIVKDSFYTGFSAVHKWRLTHWFEAEREISKAELMENIDYSVEDIYLKYFEQEARMYGVTVDELSDDIKYKETPFVPYHPYAINQAVKRFGHITMTNINPKREPNDGAKMSLILKK